MFMINGWKVFIQAILTLLKLSYDQFKLDDTETTLYKIKNYFVSNKVNQEYFIMKMGHFQINKSIFEIKLG